MVVRSWIICVVSRSIGLEFLELLMGGCKILGILDDLICGLIVFNVLVLKGTSWLNCLCSGFGLN